MSALRLDPTRGVATIRRTLAGAQLQLAEVFARVVRGAPDARIEQLMRSPLRRIILEGIFWQMPRHVDGRQAQALSCTIRWSITRRGDQGADVFELEFVEGRCRVTRGGRTAEPRLTITLDAVEFLRLATGNADPMRAYFSGDLGLAGDIMLAAKLASLFRIPGQRPASA